MESTMKNEGASSLAIYCVVPEHFWCKSVYFWSALDSALQLPKLDLP